MKTEGQTLTRKEEAKTDKGTANNTDKVVNVVVENRYGGGTY